jgi:hypothetical protein
VKIVRPPVRNPDSGEKFNSIFWMNVLVLIFHFPFSHLGYGRHSTSPYPSPEEKLRIGFVLKLLPRQVEVWFGTTFLSSPLMLPLISFIANSRTRKFRPKFNVENVHSEDEEFSITDSVTELRDGC